MNWAAILIGLVAGGIVLGMSNTSGGNTPHSMGEIRAALVSAYAQIMGNAPSQASLSLLAAQIALETGNGQSLMGNNVGNFKARQGDPGAITFGTNEYVGGKLIHLPAGSPGAWFKSWPDLTSGMVAYLKALRGQFGASWSSVIAGDTEGFASALKQHGYFTAPLYNETDSTGKFVPGYIPGLLSRGAPPVSAASGVASAASSGDDGDDPSGTMENQDDTASASSSSDDDPTAA